MKIKSKLKTHFFLQIFRCLYEIFYSASYIDISTDDCIERMSEMNHILLAETTKTTKKINKSLCRLINPPKSDIGKIMKTILDKIITKIVSLTNVNQWENSNSNVEWYKAITTKDQHRFAIFDTESFYPSISLHLFNDAVNFAKP